MRGLRRFFRLPGGRRAAPYVEGHRLELLQGGGRFFPRLREELSQAQHYIFIETYILQADETGWRVARILMERAEAGVEVALMYDGLGSHGLDPGFVEALEAAGAKLHAFRPLNLWRGVWPWSRRNHRKLVVIDGRVGFVGGMNLARDYASAEEGGANWRDTSVCIEGPAVGDLELLFRWLWRRETKSPVKSERGPIVMHPGGVALRFLPNFARGERAMVRRAYLAAILGARERIRITNAYFFPDRSIRRALIKAAKRGVQVELIVAGTSDVRPAVYAAQSLYSRFLRAGIEIYEWYQTVLHAKTAVVDGQWSIVGSSNLDPLSSFVNLEVNAGVFSHHFGEEMDGQFEKDRLQSRRIEASKWRRRSLSQRLRELFFRILAKRY